MAVPYNTIDKRGLIFVTESIQKSWRSSLPYLVAQKLRSDSTMTKLSFVSFAPKVLTNDVKLKEPIRKLRSPDLSENNECKIDDSVDQPTEEGSKERKTRTPSVSHVWRNQSNLEFVVQKTTPSFKIDCTQRILSSEISYETTYLVLTSWQEKILRIPNWSLPTGESFLRHIFRLAPVTIKLFGFSPDTKYDDPKLSQNPKFTTKGARLIQAIDMAAMFLGPDLEPFEKELYDLGWRHIAMQARPEYWPVVGEALLCTFEDHMIGGFTQKERDAWTIVS
jgi:hypothetical protein